MTPDASHLAHAWAYALIDQLVGLGVRHFFIAPGSRSTPLTLAVARHPGATAHVHFDERGTAFMALGAGRATGMPAVWITTSGTAVANGFPAIVEADVDHVPLLMLTADRPPELRATGANQTIDQAGIFGRNVRWFFDLPVAEASLHIDTVRSTAAEAFGRTMGPTAGPVHLNVMFREPLVPVDSSTGLPTPSGRLFQRSTSRFQASADAVERLAEAIRGARRGLIVAGRIRTREEAASVANLGRALRWPVLADVLSQLRFFGMDDEDAVVLPDLILAAGEAPAPPDVVVHFGDAPVSKRLINFVAEAEASSFVVTSQPARIDPFHRVDEHVTADYGGLAADLLPRITGTPADDSYLRSWQAADERIGQALRDVMDSSDALTEPAAARLVAGLIPDGHHLVLGSSMPIRDVDSFSSRRDAKVDVFANRGASGIDGTIATAIGIAEASERPVTVLLGDLALLHDLNSLAALKDARRPVIIVVVNNDGGGIFSFLPVVDRTDIFERFFGMPHGLGFEQVAAMFGTGYHAPATIADLRRVYRHAAERGDTALIEVRTDRRANVDEHRRIIELIKQAP